MSYDDRPTRMLALGGSDQRGLSSLIVLKELMQCIKKEKLPLPCRHFDMIGGVGPGGFIAIMLGRLRMGVDECIDAFVELCGKLSQRYNVNSDGEGRVRTKLSKAELEDTVKSILLGLGILDGELLFDRSPVCRVCVCVTNIKTGSELYLTTYSPRRNFRDDFSKSTTIWQACCATLAVWDIFEPASIGNQSDKVDVCSSNRTDLVDVLWTEVQNIVSHNYRKTNWLTTILSPRCIVSFNTGSTDKLLVEDDFIDSSNLVVRNLRPDADSPAHLVIDPNEDIVKQGLYYRFNVHKEVPDKFVLDEPNSLHRVMAATSVYIRSPVVSARLRACANNISKREYFGPYRTLPRLQGVLAFRDFVEHPSVTARLEEVLLPESYLHFQRKKIFVLHGGAGIGKTPHAAAFARKHQRTFSSVFWVNGRSEEAIKKSLAGYADSIPQGQIAGSSRTPLQDDDGVETTVVTDVLRWLARADNVHWLLIFDGVNLIHKTEDETGPYDMQQYFPGSHGSVLITTRLKQLAPFLKSTGPTGGNCEEVVGESFDLTEYRHQVTGVDKVFDQNFFFFSDSDLDVSLDTNYDLVSVTKPGYAESIFSKALTAEFSANSSISWMIDRSAKDELVSFFLDDADLQPFFVAAINDPEIGGRRLQRNFRRLLSDYGEELLTTTQNKVHRRAANFVVSNASYISGKVQQHFETNLPGLTSAPKSKLDSQDETGGKYMLNKYIAEQEKIHAVPRSFVAATNHDEDQKAEKPPEAFSEQDSDSGNSQIVLEQAQADEQSITIALEEVKEFLSSGPPMQNLRLRLEIFVSPCLEEAEERRPGETVIQEMKTDTAEDRYANPELSKERTTESEQPKDTRPELSEDSMTDSQQSEKRVIEHKQHEQCVPESDENVSSELSVLPMVQEPEGIMRKASRISLPDFIDCIMEALQFPFWERSVPPGMSRVRWRCRCGINLYDDFIELVPGSLTELESQLRAVNGGGTGPGQRRNWNAIGTISTLFTALIRPTHRKEPNNDVSLPLHNQPQSINIGAPGGTKFHLLCCIHSGEAGIVLHQEFIKQISTDRQLVMFLNDIYDKRRSVLSRFTLQHVSKLLLARFEVDLSSFVQIHRHTDACQAPDCVCLPTLDRVDGKEYHCEPAPRESPRHVPVFGDTYLIHYFKHPECLSETQKTIFNQLPKRVCGPLAATDDKLALGWGVYFEEGWHWRSVNFILIVVIITGSIVFGVLLSILKSDIQSAWAIASSWMTLGALLLGYMAVRSTG